MPPRKAAAARCRARGFAASADRITRCNPGDRASDRVGARRPDDAVERRNLVCQRLSTHWSRRVFVAFGPTHVRHPSGPPAHHAADRCATCSCWPVTAPFKHAVLHRRRYRCAAQAGVAHLMMAASQGAQRPHAPKQNHPRRNTKKLARLLPCGRGHQVRSIMPFEWCMVSAAWPVRLA